MNATVAALSDHSTDPDALAEALAAAAPSAGSLDALAFERLSAEGRVDALVACEKHLRHAHALMVRALSVLDRLQQQERGLRITESEVSVALCWAPTTAQQRLSDAGALTRLFPETVNLLGQGTVSWEQARALVQLTGGLEDEAAREVQARVLPRMAGQTVALTRKALRRAVDKADPEAAAKRHSHERARRRLELFPENDGMATLSLYAPAQTADAMMATITRLAKRRATGDTRTLDQRRADIFAGLVLSAAGVRFNGTQDPAIPALVKVVVNIETLLGLGSEPGELEGHGPICAEQARRIAHAQGSRWRFLLTASDGTLADASERTYTPRAATRRAVQLKFRTCAFPHCAMPATRCDCDDGAGAARWALTRAATDALAVLSRNRRARRAAPARHGRPGACDFIGAWPKGLITVLSCRPTGRVPSRMPRTEGRHYPAWQNRQSWSVAWTPTPIATRPL
jgi:hypothetical protein